MAERSPPVLKADALIGTRLLDRYELLIELGRGGRGVVYLAHDLSLDRRVALKLVERSGLSDEDQIRFEREALAAAKMDHPSIVSLFDFCRDTHYLFLVMPYLRGRNLRARMQLGLTPEEAVAVARDAAGALAYSHSLGIVHRDIKPENIMLQDEATGPPRAKLVDFGLAFRTGDKRLTQQGALIGTLAYLSPEVVEGEAVGSAADVYSLGVVLYECLVGSPPFRGSWQSTLYQIACTKPPGLLEQGVVLDPDLEALVLRCLSKKAEERPTADELATTFDNLLGRVTSGGSRVVPPTDTAAPEGPPTLLDRQQELNQLLRRLDAAVDGQCQLVLIGGGDGVGKSSLAREFLLRAESRATYRLAGEFLDHRKGSLPFEGYCQALLRFALELEPGRSPTQRELSRLWPELADCFPRLRELPASLADRRRGNQAPGRRRRSKRQVFDLVARAVAAIADGGPTVLLLEDLDYADVSLELLEYLFRRLGPTPVLLLGTFRPSEVDERHPLTGLIERLSDSPRFQVTNLGPLPERDTRALLGTFLDQPTSHPRAGSTAIDPAEHEVWLSPLVEIAEGNPRFGLELVRFLTESGTLRRDPRGRWSLLQRNVDLRTAIPLRLEQVLRRRVEALDETLRATLDHAAVLGHPFRPAALDALGATTPKVWRELVRQGLLVEHPGPRGLFLSLASRELLTVLLQELPYRRRRSLHRRVARALESHGEEAVELRQVRLLHHFTQGDEPEKAVHYGLLAARSQLDAHAPDDAVNSLESLIDFVEDDDWPGAPETAVQVRSLLATSHFTANRHSETLNEARRAWAMAETLAGPGATRTDGSEPKLPGFDIEVLQVAARAAWILRRLPEAWTWTARGLAATGGPQQTRLRRQFLDLGEAILRHRGDEVEAAKLRQEADALRETSRSGEQSSTGKETGYAERLGELLLIRGEYLAAQEAFEAARDQRLARAGATGQSAEDARYRSRLAQLALKLGRYAEAREHCRQGLELLAEHHPLRAAELEILAALIDCTAGDFAQAEVWIARGAERLQELPSDTSKHDRLRIEGALERARGNYFLGFGKPRNAIEAYARSAECFETIEEPWEHSIALFNRAEAEIRIGAHDAALDHLERALAEKSTLGDRWGMAHCHGGKARILLERGDLRDADEAVAKGLALASEVADPKLTSQLHTLRGHLLDAEGELEEALQAFHLALRDAERVLANPEVVQAHLGLARVSAALGRFDTARSSTGEALTRSEISADPAALAEVQASLGRIGRAEGQCREAQRCFESALARANEVGNPYQIAQILIALGNTHRICGELKRSRHAFAQVRHLGRQLSSPRLIARAALGQARAHLVLGHGERTLELATLALEEAQRQDASRLIGAIYELLARHYTQQAQYRRAETYAQAAAEIFSVPQRGYGRFKGRVFLALADLHRSAGDFERERDAVDQAWELLAASNDRSARLDAQRARAQVLGRRDPDAALELLDSVLTDARTAGYLLGEARAQSEHCELLRRLGRLDEALASAENEQRLLESIGHRRWQAINIFHFASLHFERGDLEEALKTGGRLDHGHHSIGSIGRLIHLELRSQIETALGSFDLAQESLDQAFRIAERFDHPLRIANLQASQVDLLTAQGRYGEAHQVLDTARAGVDRLPATNAVSYGSLIGERLTILALRLDLAAGAQQGTLDTTTVDTMAGQLEEPLAALDTLGVPLTTFDAQLVLAEALILAGQLETAEPRLRSLVAEAKGYGAKLRQADAQFLLALATGELPCGRRAVRLALATGSWRRIARSARLLASLEDSPKRSRRQRALASHAEDQLDGAIAPEHRPAARAHRNRWPAPALLEAAT